MTRHYLNDQGCVISCETHHILNILGEVKNWREIRIFDLQ